MANIDIESVKNDHIIVRADTGTIEKIAYAYARSKSPVRYEVIPGEGNASLLTSRADFKTVMDANSELRTQIERDIDTSTQRTR